MSNGVSERTSAKVLVTGGCGFIGAGMVAALVKAGHAVTVFDNVWRGSRDNLSGVAGRVKIREADIRDAAAVKAAVAEAEFVVHLAAIQGTGNFYRIPDEVLDVNVKGVMNVLDACRQARPKRLFFSSSSEVYGIPTVFPTPESAPIIVPDVLNPRYSYSISKIVGEAMTVHYAAQAKFDYTIVRYHNVYGPAMGWDHVIPQFIGRLVRGEEFTVQGDGLQTRAFCYIDDAVDCSIHALFSPAGANQTFNIGNPDAECTINDLVALLGGVSGRRIVPRHLPFPGEGTRRRLPDISRARELLGFSPQITLKEGLARTYAWYANAISAGHISVAKESQ